MSANIAYYGGIVTNGLVLYMDAAKRDSYPGFGNNWNSVARGGLITGSLVNGPTFDSANGGGIRFDGTDDYANLGPIFNFTSEDFTFSYWVYFNTLITNIINQGPIIIYKGSYRVNGYYDQIQLNGTCIFVTNQSGAHQATATNVGIIQAQKWYNICYTRITSSVRIYINGIDSTLTQEVHVNPTSNSNNFLLSLYSVASIYANLKLSNFLTYNRALSASEVLQNYNALKGRFGL